ncbi:hypothetical protein JTE90_016761 [Oedothorax gibbosus]|uniref:Uncharacterized protein n=1 Tax=Oedothorax gibbosus TaxID=931172 RepID=A0AAV6VYZ4_9ARAC|nr:hypothetical protein JTE90_016761 [Oedothorax gibbosus]
MEKSDNNVKCVQFGTISESMRHDGRAVWGHLLPVLQMIQKTWPHINTIHFQSDGPTTQYRNKTNLFLLTYFANKLGLKEVTWDFSEADHGKSSADGVGGQLKTKAVQFVAHGTDIPDAHTFYTVLKNSEIKVQLFQVSTKDIEAIDEHVMPGLKAITNTMKLKQVVWGSKSPNQLSLRTLSCFACEVKCKHYASKPSVWNFATIPALRPISQKPHRPISQCTKNKKLLSNKI